MACSTPAMEWRSSLFFLTIVFCVSVNSLHVGLVEGGGMTPVPGEELVELAHWMSGRHAFENVPKIGEGLDAVELGGGDGRSGAGA